MMLQIPESDSVRAYESAVRFRETLKSRLLSPGPHGPIAAFDYFVASRSAPNEVLPIPIGFGQILFQQQMVEQPQQVRWWHEEAPAPIPFEKYAKMSKGALMEKSGTKQEDSFEPFHPSDVRFCVSLALLQLRDRKVA